MTGFARAQAASALTTTAVFAEDAALPVIADTDASGGLSATGLQASVGAGAEKVE